MGCFCVISFANIDITQKANTQNVQYANKLTSAGYDAAQSMKDYASAAAMAGISANSYAEQAVSFGASLKQAFGDDIPSMVSYEADLTEYEEHYDGVKPPISQKDLTELENRIK